MIYVPRQGDISYTTGMRDYVITTYRKTAENTYEKIDTVSSAITAKVTKNDTGYLVLEIPESDDISRITVNVGQWEGAKAVTLSEAAFYHLDNTPAEIADLFADGAFSTLKYSASETLSKVEELRSRVKSTNAFYLNKDIMLQELNDAVAIAEGAAFELKSDFQSRNTSSDSQYGQTASILQPLGVTAKAGNDVIIYAHIPEGEEVFVVPTQYFAEVSSWKGDAIALKNGRNIISIPQISSVAPEKGGPLYITYTGEKADEIKIRTSIKSSAGAKTPVLELSNWYTLSEEERKEKISDYIADVKSYVQANSSKLSQTSIFNHTDISTPSVLLSIPVKESASTITVDSLYNAILAWEDVSYVVNTTQGIVDVDRSQYQYPMESRQNIRYMHMFGSAFMYAAGNHIGVGYNSAAPLLLGTPADSASHGAENGLYGWGIAHEIGHNMDKLGKTEITNNLYSLMVQSYDGGDMTSFATRLESEDRYSSIFQKTAEARPGSANNVFVQLGMYWQLHLAYDNASDPMNFYNEFFKLWKNGEYSEVKDYDNRFALVASKVADKDLSEFFTRWGMELTESTLSTLSKYDDETRAVWYMNDDSRRNRLNGTGKASGTVSFDNISTTTSSNGQNVTLTFSHSDNENILGYEIIKDGKSVAFTKGTSYTEHIGTANNTVIKYAVRAVDKQGNMSEISEEKQVRISYDNVLDSSLYELSKDGTTATITIKGDAPQSVSGIKLSNASGVDTITAVITTNVDGQEKETALTLTENMASDLNTFKSYFKKPGSDSTDSRIWTYDITKIVLENVPESATVELITAVNDDVAFLQDGAAIGRLLFDYQWGDTAEEVIPAGSLVIVGTYVGDPVYNYVQINGEYTVRDLETGAETTEIRPVSGSSYLLAEVPEDGEVSLISNGMFIYEINEEAEGELNHDHIDCDNPSSLPDRIQAVLYRSDSSSTTNGRVTAQTIWITSPTEDGMPSIVLEHN